MLTVAPVSGVPWDGDGFPPSIRSLDHIEMSVGPSRGFADHGVPNDKLEAGGGSGISHVAWSAWGETKEEWL